MYIWYGVTSGFRVFRRAAAVLVIVLLRLPLFGTCGVNRISG
jgi:hypothetical protein